MAIILPPPAADRAAYWNERVRAETEAALACDNPRAAALHVEIATRCLRQAQHLRSVESK